MSSTEDDLMLGVEATIYTSALQNMTFKEYVRTFHSEKQTLGRMNSTASATSLNIGPQSVFEFLDVWHSDPEEILLDLGFGKEEPEILTKIPARFINGSSVAIGINIRVFLDALKLRMEMENLDLYKIATQNSSPELSVAQVHTFDVTKERRALLRKMSQKNIKNSQTLEESRESKGNTMKSLKRDRKNYFLYARQFIPEDDSILSPLTVGQSGEQKKAPDLLLDLKMSRDDPLLETSAKDKDDDMQFLIPQAKKLKRIMNDQLPDSFEMEEMQSFDEDSSLRMPANKICLDMKRENSCQSDSSGFVEEPFIPSQILHTLKNFGWDSRASSQESKQWPVHVSNPGQATYNVTDPTSHSASTDNDQAKCSEASTALHVSQEQEKITVENLDHNPHAFDDHQKITCIDKVTGEESELNDNNSHLPTMPFKAPKDDSIADADVWKNNQTQKENDDIDNQNNNSVSTNAIIVNNIPAIQQEPSLHLPHSTALSKLVTIQIPQETLPQINVTDVHLSDPQLNEDPVKQSAFQESGKMRDASVQTEDNTGDLTVKNSQPDQIKNFTRLVPEFQPVSKITKSVSLDTGLHIVEQNTRKQTAITPVHCLCCHHCSCVQHCSSICFKASNMKSPSKMAMSHTEAQLIKTLQQLQQTARVICGSPQVLREIETMKKCLRGFRNRLVDIEQDIIEQQASVYNVLTEQERDEVKRLQTLRRAVRQEVTEIEDQLEDQARQVGETMKMQLLCLLEEQSSLCSYVEMLKQTRDFGLDSQHRPSSICVTSMPAAVSISQELESNAGRILSIHSTLAQGPINSPVTSASSKTDTEDCSEAAKGTELSEKKQDHQAETLDFKTILQHIKQSFKHLRSAGSEKTENTK